MSHFTYYVGAWPLRGSREPVHSRPSRVQREARNRATRCAFGRFGLRKAKKGWTLRVSGKGISLPRPITRSHRLKAKHGVNMLITWRAERSKCSFACHHLCLGGSRQGHVRGRLLGCLGLRGLERAGFFSAQGLRCT